MNEIYICTQHLKGFTYSDVLAMPIYERRFFLGLLTKDAKEREERMETIKHDNKNKNSKGSRSTRVSGEALKSRIKRGEIPTK